MLKGLSSLYAWTNVTGLYTWEINGVLAATWILIWSTDFYLFIVTIFGIWGADLLEDLRYTMGTYFKGLFSLPLQESMRTYEILSSSVIFFSESCSSSAIGTLSSILISFARYSASSSIVKTWVSSAWSFLEFGGSYDAMAFVGSFQFLVLTYEASTLLASRSGLFLLLNIFTIPNLSTPSKFCFLSNNGTS